MGLRLALVPAPSCQNRAGEPVGGFPGLLAGLVAAPPLRLRNLGRRDGVPLRQDGAGLVPPSFEIGSHLKTDMRISVLRYGHRQTARQSRYLKSYVARAAVFRSVRSCEGYSTAAIR